MSATLPICLPQYEEPLAAPDYISTDPLHLGDEGNEDNMPPNERLDRIERLIERQVEASAGNGTAEKRRQNIFMGSIAVITILGAAGNFVGSSGMWVGKSQTDFQHQAETVKELREEVSYLKTWNEKLRNNMSAYGWLIDIDGNVSRIEQKPTRRR